MSRRNGFDTAYPVKLNDAYPCQGYDADGKPVFWEDLLDEGMRVGPSIGDDVFPNATVVRKSDGLWVVGDDPTPRAK